MNIDFTDLSPSKIYHLMTQTVIPRPIAWVLTENHQANNTDFDQFNLAPFSYFNAVCSHPPLLMISLGKKPSGSEKDTALNLTLDKLCVVHIAHVEQAVSVTKSAATLDYGHSELNDLSLTLTKQNDFSLPRLTQSNIAFNCSVYEIKEIGDAAQQLIFLIIKSVFVADNVISEDDKGRLQINAHSVDPLARLGANQYSGISRPFDLNRPK